MADPKGIAAAIMAKRAPPDDSGGDDEYSLAASNILDAVKNDDVAGLAAELKSFVEMCSADSASPEEDELAAE